MRRTFPDARVLFPILISVSLAAHGCAGPETASSRGPIEIAPVELERPPGSGEPNLHATPEGEVLLTWLEPVSDGRWALRLAIRESGAWTEPRTVRESDRFFVNWADFPSSVRMEDGTIAVHWLEKVPAASSPYAYHVMLSLSADRGATWSEPIRAHRDDSPTEHGFVSMIPWRGGAAVVWLDGRAMQGAESEDGGHGVSGAMSVRFTTVLPDATLGAEVLLDGRTCECCGTALAAAGDGLVTAYRDRSETEIRDIAVVRGAGETWTEPALVAAQGWEIPGCPVNGPQLSADGAAVAAAWYTGAGNEPQVYVAFSNDGGASFGTAVRVDEGAPLGRVDIERLADGSAIVTWLEASGDEPRIVARRVHADGTLEPALLVARTSGERASGFPRMVRAGDELVFAWTAPGEDGGVRVRSARLTD